MIDHEEQFAWVQPGDQVSAVVEDGRLCVVVRLTTGQLAAIWGPGPAEMTLLPENLRVYAIQSPNVKQSDLDIVRMRIAQLEAERDQARADLARWQERFRAAVNDHCSCGGSGPGDAGCCPPCLVWHRTQQGRS
jgi:multidrug resistance efflux pump